MKMIYNRIKRLLAISLAAVMLLGIVSGCTPSPDSDPNHEQTKEDSPMETISLNGQWDFYKDSAAAAGTLKNIGVIDSTQSLVNGSEITATLKISRPEEMFYSKLRLTMQFGGDLTTTGGAAPTVYAKVGNGDYFATNIGDLTHNLNSDLHTVDVGLYFADLVAGENTVTVKTNIVSGDITLSEVALCYYPVLMFRDSLQKITVPGVWETQLGAEYTAYNGVGWYSRSFDLPRAAAGQQYTLTFHAIDYYAEIWLNGRFITSHEDGYSAVVIDLGQYADILQTHNNRLTVRVTDQDTDADAAFPIKQTLAGFYHDSVGINFAGIWNDVTLSPRGLTRLNDLTIRTDVDTMCADVIASVKNVGNDTTLDAVVTILDGETVMGSKTLSEITVSADGTAEIDASLPLPNAKLWEISTPQIYTARVELKDGETIVDSSESTFGFTSVRAQEDKILFNDRIIKINGILSWLGNWEQLSPKFDKNVFTEQIRALKAYGFNAIKFCLVVPTEEILSICDREGIYVYIEYPVWNPVQTDAFYERAYSQMGRFLNMSKNHPSVIMSDFNCEMQVFEDPMLDFMNWCVSTGKRIDPNRLYADNSSTGRQNTQGDNDFWTWHPYTNALGFADYAKSVVANRTSNGQKPVVFGEYADYPALADFDTILTASGGEPWNWDAVDDPFRADLYLKNLGYSDEQIRNMIAYSEENCVDMKMYYVQETKKADSVAAYFLTIIQDIGHSVAGFFDELGNVKFTPEQTAFLKESVLLLDTNVYNFTAGKTTTLTPAISHYDGTEIQNGTLSWTLLDRDGTPVAGGELADGIDLENGCYETFGNVELDMPDVDTAAAHTLTLTLTAENGYKISSSWEIYLYPETPAADLFDGKSVMVSGDNATYNFKKRYPSVTDWKNGAEPDLLIAFDRLTDAQLTYLKNGGKVLYIGTGSEVAKVEMGTFYSQYVMVHFPNEDHEIVTALDSKGFGGLQFLNLQTQHVITQAKDDPVSHSIIGKLLLRDNVGDIGQSASYMSEFAVGDGTVIQCTLNVTGDRVLGNYLIDTAAQYLLK
ncbi:MAG: hypothetical protein IJW40_10260 [Clostridia bacterium]|nr:hypothetical protein [Clostridia bacterium]